MKSPHCLIKLFSAAGVILLCCSLAPYAGGQNEQKRHQREIVVGGVRITIPDIVLCNQDDKKVRFYSDLIKGKVVVLSFFYTGCSYTCAMQGEIFSRLQAELGARLGKDVFLISATRDPETDTPVRLKEWGNKYGVRPGWILVSGDVSKMNLLLGSFTGDSAGRREMHSALIYIGNDRTGEWTAADGLTPPSKLVEMIEAVAGKTGEQSKH